MKLFKIRVYFVGSVKPAGVPNIEKANGVLYKKALTMSEAVDAAITSAKASKIFKDMTFEKAVSQEIRSKKLRKEYGLT